MEVDMNYFNINKLNDFLKDKKVNIKFKILPRAIKAPKSELIKILKVIDDEISKFPPEISATEIIYLCDLAEKINYSISRFNQ